LGAVVAVVVVPTLRMVIVVVQVQGIEDEHGG